MYLVTATWCAPARLLPNTRHSHISVSQGRRRGPCDNFFIFRFFFSTFLPKNCSYFFFCGCDLTANTQHCHTQRALSHQIALGLFTVWRLILLPSGSSLHFL